MVYVGVKWITNLEKFSECGIKETGITTVRKFIPRKDIQKRHIFINPTENIETLIVEGKMKNRKV